MAPFWQLVSDSTKQLRKSTILDAIEKQFGKAFSIIIVILVFYG